MKNTLPPAFGPGELIPVFPVRKMEYCCDVPKELGRPTGREMRGKKVICPTESGIDLIVPHPRGT